MSTTLSLAVSIIVFFSYYGVILSKFYKRRKRFDTLKRSLNSDYLPKMRKISFTQKVLFFFNLKFGEKHSFDKDDDVYLRQMTSISENGEIFKIDLQPDRKAGQRKSSSLSRHLSFHVSYLKSSNYVLVTLLTFWMLHSPIFVYQTVELIR